MLLQKLGESVQQIADAIASALDSNVTIVDENLVRVAGTGPYLEKVDKKAPERSVFARILERKETVLIRNPGEDPDCHDCALKEDCVEKYEICTPIIWQGRAVGVIAIFAYDQKQKDMLMEKEKNYIIFLKNMANLIASKVGELKLYEDVMAYSKELDIIIQNVDQGVLCVDKNGQIKHVNRKAQELLSLDIPLEELQGRRLQDIWPGALILKALKEGKEFFDQEENYNTTTQKKHFLSTTRLIEQKGEVICGVVTFTDLEVMQKSVYRVTKSSNWSLDNIIGVSDKIKECKEKARQVAAYDSTVLIIGESGTGKEVFARAIHNTSSRANYPFIAINCSAIPESLLESELFGYEAGAFTGAGKAGKPGKFELAHQGTIFLDEIGDMPLFLQAKLLRVLQEESITRVGGVKPVDIDVRVIAATNQDLNDLIAKKMFRKDLYYRLNVIPLHLYPLRERVEDIPVLIDYFLSLYNQRFGKNILGFTPKALDFMLNYSWPGNVRELENVIEYGINFCKGKYIKVEEIKGRFKSTVLQSKNKNLKEMVSEYERNVIEKMLNKYGWDEEGKARVAEELEISRSTLYRKLTQK